MLSSMDQHFGPSDGPRHLIVGTEEQASYIREICASTEGLDLVVTVSSWNDEEST